MRKLLMLPLLCGALPALARSDLRDVLQGTSFPGFYAARVSGGGWLDDGGAPAPSETRRVSTGPAANRLAYLTYQTALSTYVYGVGLPLGLGVDEPRILIAAPQIAAPLLFGVHLATAPHLEFTESHLKASMYVPTAAVYSATALSLAFSPDAGAGYRIGSLVGAGVYPLGLWYAQHLGDVYRSEPDRLDSKMLFALGYGFVGLVTPVLYFEHPSKNSENIMRIGLGQSVGMAAVGHVVADYYQPRLSTGVQLGLATHTVLGGLAGIAAAAYADASASPRPWVGATIIGSTLGFTEGVFFFNGSTDSRERSQYAGLGGLGGSMMGLGLQILFFNGDASTYGQKISWASFLVGGAWAGYWATYALTRGMTETASTPPSRGGQAASEPARWSFNPLPEPEVVLSRGEPASRWKIPGVQYKF